jgi:tetratricopeptide (TPR) repeat protein
LANLGNLSADAGEWERARAYYLEALDLMNLLSDFAGKAVVLSDLGLVARETEQDDDALAYYQESLILMRRVGNEAGQADVFRMMARLYLSQRRFDEAQSCTLTSLDVARRLKDELRMGGAWYVLANCHEARGEWKKAVHYLQKVVRVDEKYQLPKLAENTQRLEALSARLAGSPESPHE